MSELREAGCPLLRFPPVGIIAVPAELMASALSKARELED